jgi:hypothetical protein
MNRVYRMMTRTVGLPARFCFPAATVCPLGDANGGSLEFSGPCAGCGFGRTVSARTRFGLV